MLGGMPACSHPIKGGPDAQNRDTLGRAITEDAVVIAPGREDGAGIAVGETGKPEAAADTPGQLDSPAALPDASIFSDASVSGLGADTSADAVPKGVFRKFVGNTLNLDVRSDFVKYWDQLSIGPAGQYGAVRSGPLQYDWSYVDTIYDFTRKAGIPFHEYALIHGQEEPRYFGTDDEARTGVEDWIRSFCARYPDAELINVVYEPLHIKPSYATALGGAGASGYDWILQSFVWARTHCPNSILLLTDYNTIEYKMESDAFIKMVGALLAAGAPIDALGAAAVDAPKVSTSTLKSYINKLAALGLPLYITEYGIAEQDDAKQLAIMKEQFPLFWTDDRIKGITLWGYVVGDTWRNGMGMVSPDGTPRPAMTWLMSYLGR
jgi:endo-1,4-beta-xylanase